jgi:hypothetical protein
MNSYLTDTKKFLRINRRSHARALAFLFKEYRKKVEMGKTMSSSGLTYKDKVFCFTYGDKTLFKLGKAYDIESHGITEYEHLNPFKKNEPIFT